jgi:hypothetical protein
MINFDIQINIVMMYFIEDIFRFIFISIKVRYLFPSVIAKRFSVIIYSPCLP